MLTPALRRLTYLTAILYALLGLIMFAAPGHTSDTSRESFAFCHNDDGCVVSG